MSLKKYENMCAVEIIGIVLDYRECDDKPTLILQYTSDDCMRIAHFKLVASNEETARRFTLLRPQIKSGKLIGEMVRVTGTLSVRGLLINVDNISDMNTAVDIKTIGE